MALNIISIGSSSSGNSYIIQSEKANILLDVGVSAKKIKEGISYAYLTPQNIDAICITHEHVDHVKSIRAISKECTNATVYASSGTIANCENFKHVPRERLSSIRAGEERKVGDIILKAFRVSHDAGEPLGFSFTDGDEKLTVVTDTGKVIPEIYSEMLSSDKLLIESNYEEQLLMVGPYPYNVKRRIKGDLGHLSNVDAASCVASILAKRKQSGIAAPLHLMLGHISTNNNTMFQAALTMQSELEAASFEKDKDFIMTIAEKSELIVME